MPLCSSGCAVAPRPYGVGACRTVTRPGGIYKFLHLQCDVAVPALTIEALGAAIDAQTLVASGKVLASQAKGTTTKQRVNSCDPERPTNRTEIINWKDYNADNEDFSEFDYWNDKFENQDRFLLGWTTCDELVYGFISSYSLDFNPNRPETSNEASFIEGAFELNTLLLLKPTKVAGINALLQVES